MHKQIHMTLMIISESVFQVNISAQEPEQSPGGAAVGWALLAPASSWLCCRAGSVSTARAGSSPSPRAETARGGRKQK